MTVDSEGCNIQHLAFESVASMLDYFKTNSIPLEAFWLSGDIKLTTYIDRQLSDAFRTTIVLNVDQLNRVPPRRSRSLHLGVSHAVMNASSHPNTPSPSSPAPHSSTMERRGASSTNSLQSHGSAASGWRALFRSNRSSSAGNVGRVQRSHSHNAGSIQSTQTNHENAYVWRNYWWSIHCTVMLYVVHLWLDAIGIIVIIIILMTW